MALLLNLKLPTSTADVASAGNEVPATCGATAVRGCVGLQLLLWLSDAMQAVHAVPRSRKSASAQAPGCNSRDAMTNAATQRSCFEQQPRL